MRSVPLLLGEGLRLTFSAAAEARDLTLAVAICLASSNDLRRGDVERDRERERERERACALIRAISLALGTFKCADWLGVNLLGLGEGGGGNIA